MLHVDIIYLKCRRQKYAIITVVSYLSSIPAILNLLDDVTHQSYPHARWPTFKMKVNQLLTMGRVHNQLSQMVKIFCQSWHFVTSATNGETWNVPLYVLNTCSFNKSLGRHYMDAYWKVQRLVYLWIIMYICFGDMWGAKQRIKQFFYDIYYEEKSQTMNPSWTPSSHFPQSMVDLSQEVLRIRKPWLGRMRTLL